MIITLGSPGFVMGFSGEGHTDIPWVSFSLCRLYISIDPSVYWLQDNRSADLGTPSGNR